MPRSSGIRAQEVSELALNRARFPPAQLSEQSAHGETRLAERRVGSTKHTSFCRCQFETRPQAADGLCAKTICCLPAGLRKR